MTMRPSSLLLTVSAETGSPERVIDVVLAPARRPGLARIERLVGDDGFDLGDAVRENRVGEVGEAVALAIGRVDQRGVAGADEEEAGRRAFGRDEAEGCADARGPAGSCRRARWKAAATVKSLVLRREGSVVGVDGDQLAAVQRRDDEAPARAFEAGRIELARAVREGGAGGEGEEAGESQEIALAEPSEAFPKRKAASCEADMTTSLRNG